MAPFTSAEICCVGSSSQIHARELPEDPAQEVAIKLLMRRASPSLPKAAGTTCRGDQSSR